MARLEDYSFGRLMVDGSEHTNDLIVLPHLLVAERRRGTAVEGPRTEEAVRRYQQVDARPTGAALHLTC